MLLSLAGAPLESVFCLCIALMDSVRRRPLPRRRRCRRLHPDLYSLSLRQLYLGPRSSAIRDKKARARCMPNGRDSAAYHPVHVISGQRLWLIAAGSSAHTKRYGWCANCCPYRLRSRWENAYRHCAPCSRLSCVHRWDGPWHRACLARHRCSSCNGQTGHCWARNLSLRNAHGRLLLGFATVQNRSQPR